MLTSVSHISTGNAQSAGTAREVWGESLSSGNINGRYLYGTHPAAAPDLIPKITGETGEAAHGQSSDKFNTGGEI